MLRAVVQTQRPIRRNGRGCLLLVAARCLGRTLTAAPDVCPQIARAAQLAAPVGAGGTDAWQQEMLRGQRPAAVVMSQVLSCRCCRVVLSPCHGGPPRRGGRAQYRLRGGKPMPANPKKRVPRDATGGARRGGPAGWDGGGWREAVAVHGSVAAVVVAWGAVAWGTATGTRDTDAATHVHTHTHTHRLISHARARDTRHAHARARGMRTDAQTRRRTDAPLHATQTLHPERRARGTSGGPRPAFGSWLRRSSCF